MRARPDCVEKRRKSQRQQSRAVSEATESNRDQVRAERLRTPQQTCSISHSPSSFSAGTRMFCIVRRGSLRSDLQALLAYGQNGDGVAGARADESSEHPLRRPHRRKVPVRPLRRPNLRCGGARGRG